MYICDVKACTKPVEHKVKVGPLFFGVCTNCHEEIFELARQFEDEFNNMSRRYFRLVLNLKKEDEKPATRAGQTNDLLQD